MNLLIGNDHYVTLTGLKNGLDGAIVASATVSLTVLDRDAATPIAGVTWPVLLDPVSGSPGDYAGKLPREVDVAVGTTYNVQVVMQDPGTGLDGQFDVYARCERRTK